MTLHRGKQLEGAPRRKVVGRAGMVDTLECGHTVWARGKAETRLCASCPKVKDGDSP